MFEAGDLVYIPQDVYLWAPMNAPNTYSATNKPTTAVVIEEASDAVLLFVHGRRMSAKKKHVYPYTEESHNEGN
jgi:hypothetical protein|tara:strand:+ start:500 stop:721 length:222 start_codon:yes stop_codon:yes gene_type:complete